MYNSIEYSLPSKPLGIFAKFTFFLNTSKQKNTGYMVCRFHLHNFMDSTIYKQEKGFSNNILKHMRITLENTLV